MLKQYSLCSSSSLSVTSRQKSIQLMRKCAAVVTTVQPAVAVVDLRMLYVQLQPYDSRCYLHNDRTVLSWGTRHHHDQLPAMAIMSRHHHRDSHSRSMCSARSISYSGNGNSSMSSSNMSDDYDGRRAASKDDDDATRMSAATTERPPGSLPPRRLKFNTTMNNFQYGPRTGGNPSNPVQPGQADHPAFVKARQLLSISIGDFSKGDIVRQSDLSYDREYPVGRNLQIPVENHFQIASNLIQFFLLDRSMGQSTVRAVNATFAVIERLIREMSFTNTVAQNIHYLFQGDTQFRLLMNFWKNAALAGEMVLPAIEMIKKVQWIMTELPSGSNQCIRFDKQILSMILQVMMKQVPKDQAPLVAESLMEFVEETIAQTNNTALTPDIYIYGQILNAWVNSGLPETPMRLDDVISKMKMHNISLNTVTYGILIRFWAGKGSLIRVKTLLETMVYEGLEPDVSCLGQALYGYTRSMQPLQAISLLEQMYTKSNRTPQDVVTITAATLNILDSFKRLIIRGNDVSRNVERAEDVVRKFESSSIVPSRSDGTCLLALAFLFAFYARYSQAAMMDVPLLFSFYLVVRKTTK
jgi:hypothetical protein